MSQQVLYVPEDVQPVNGVIIVPSGGVPGVCERGLCEDGKRQRWISIIMGGGNYTSPEVKALVKKFRPTEMMGYQLVYKD